jgi:hypothetical protein
MTFRQISVRYLEPASQWLMILGIIALCQPWNLFLHRYGVTIILLGLIGFNVFSKIRPKNDVATATGPSAEHQGH